MTRQALMALPQLKRLQPGATLQLNSTVVLSTKASEEDTEERRGEEADQPKSITNLGNHILNVISISIELHSFDIALQLLCERGPQSAVVWSAV